MENYPYIAEKNRVFVLFVDENEGTVVKSLDPKFEVGTHRTFSEDEFSPYNGKIVLG